MSIQGMTGFFHSQRNAAIFQNYISGSRGFCGTPDFHNGPSRETGGTLADQRVDNWGGRGCWFTPPTEGFVLDRNHNGRYDRGQDSVLGFDFNRDGKLSKGEISRSNDILKAFNGDFDFNGDGKVSCREKRRGKCLARVAQRYDRNRDGRLDTRELNQAGAKVWTDHDKDGRVDRGELGTASSIDGRGFIGGGNSVLRGVGRGGYQIDNYGPPHPSRPWNAGGIRPGGFNPWGGGGFNPWGGGGFQPGGFQPFQPGGMFNPWGGGGFNPWSGQGNMFPSPFYF